MTIHGVNGTINVDVTESGHVIVSLKERDGLGDLGEYAAAVRLTGDGAVAFSAAVDAAGLELASREETKRRAS